MAALSSSQSKDVLEAEVPNEIMEQFRILQKALDENEKMAQEFAANTCSEEMQKLDADAEKLMRFLDEGRNELRRERLKNHELSERLMRDSQMCDLVQRRKEMLQKNPQYGRAQGIDYMHAIADEHERMLLEHESNVARFEQTLQKLSDVDSEQPAMTERDLAEHMKRFDEIFCVIAAQNCVVSEDVEKIKEMYLDYQKKLYGRYARNPFEKRKERQKMHEAISNLKGLDAFPSQHAVLSMSEFLPRQQAVAPVGSVTGFGATGNTGIFSSAKPAGSTGGFSLFGQQSAGAGKSLFGGAATSAAPSTAGKPLFGLPTTSATATTTAATVGFGGFGTTPAVATTPSLFGTTPAASTGAGLFGTATTSATGQLPLFGGAAAAPAPSITGTPAFGSTLSSASSGTLFRGSAASGPPTKSLFGTK